MNPNSIFKDAPKYLTLRYNSLNRYVHEVFLTPDTIEDIRQRFGTKDERKAEIRRIKDIANEASLVAFIFIVRKMFTEGSNAAKNAVDTFKELNVDGFRIGSKYFQGRNENVIMGDLLAEKLLNSVSDDRVKGLILSSNYLTDILKGYQTLVKNPSSLN